GESVDDIAGEMSAVGRGDRGALRALEVIMQDEFLVRLRQDQVDAGALELAMEQKIGVGNDKGTGRNLAMAMQGERLHMAPGRMPGRTTQRLRGIEAPRVVQTAPAKWLIHK